MHPFSEHARVHGTVPSSCGHWRIEAQCRFPPVQCEEGSSFGIFRDSVLRPGFKSCSHGIWKCRGKCLGPVLRLPFISGFGLFRVSVYFKGAHFDG